MAGINEYGDLLIENAGFGSDIASQRLDELDRICLHELALMPAPVHFLEYGAGQGGFINQLPDRYPGRFASLQAVDSFRFADCYHPAVTFTCMDALSHVRQQSTASFHVIFSQRMVHYLPYRQLQQWLQEVRRVLLANGRLYLSASGLHSELAEGYSHRCRQPEQRFSSLSPVMQEKHGIREKVCLYSQEELASAVMEAGLTVQACWQSDFGNIKLVAEKS